ncbi:CatB-related O-acetyltransferase [Halobacteriovorax sp. RT-1-4]|uniref:CatB-related O-acetyltransferase n=1 Tax=unclassified Halobacteriovorax TaxID=2639665 RepID=UPI00399B26A4
MIKRLVKNTFIVFLYREIKNIFITFRNEELKLGYMITLNKAKFSSHNYIGDFSSVTNSVIGRMTYTSNNVSINNATVGQFCSIGPGVKIGLGIHPTAEFVSTHPCFYSLNKQCGKTFVDKQSFAESSRIIIKNDVWIGANAIIVDNVTIGNGAIIAAGAVVVKDVGDYEVVGGVPAKFLKYRFEQKVIDRLNQEKWWDYSFEKFNEKHCLFKDINVFLKNIK